MVGNRRQRVGHGGYAVRIRHGAERRLAGGTAIHLPADRSFQRGVVRRRDLHHEIVRVLPVMNLLALALFTARQQIRIATAADGPRLGAEHAAEHDAALARVPLRHAHDPIDAAELVGARDRRTREETGRTRSRAP